jgi:nucleotide-binding universal stress UspA family protein
MNVLVAVDGSDCSRRALEFACGFARRFDAVLDVVHFSDAETEATDAILEWAREVVDEADVEAKTEVRIEDVRIRPAQRAGEAIVELATEEDYDHVIMGHHGSGMVDGLMFGSATKAVLKDASVGVTVVP